MQKGTLKLEELPKREQKLTSQRLLEIFGGCNIGGETCVLNSDCCEGYCWANMCTA